MHTKQSLKYLTNNGFSGKKHLEIELNPFYKSKNKLKGR